MASAAGQEHRKVGQRRPRRDLTEHVRDKPAMIAGVIDDVQDDFTSTHFTLPPTDQREVNFFICVGLGQSVTPSNEPGIYRLLSAP